MKELDSRYLSQVGGGLDAGECVSDSVNGFAVGAAVGGAVGLAAGAPGAAIGGLVGGLAGGAVAVSNNEACGTGDGASAAASAASASCSASAAASSCGPGDGVGGDGGGGGGGGGKVICTELCRMGAIDHALWMADLRYSQDHFSARTLRGYHLWGIPFVRLMRRHPMFASLALPPTRWFAEDIGFRMGVRAEPNWKGWVLREWLFRPVCAGLGLFARARDWRVLWPDDEALAPRA